MKLIITYIHLFEFPYLNFHSVKQIAHFNLGRYAHQPAHKHYEFGFKRGNDKHVVERYEKGGPHHDFKSKVSHI